MNTTRSTIPTHRRLAGLAAVVVVAATACSASSETPAADSVGTNETEANSDVDPPVEVVQPPASGPTTTAPGPESSTEQPAPVDVTDDVQIGPDEATDANDPGDPGDATDPGPADPNPTDPGPGDPGPGPDPGLDPDPTDPDPTHPGPDPSDPTDPDPTDPDPTDPGPGDLVVEIVDAGLIELTPEPADTAIEIVTDTGLDDLVSISPCGPVGPASTEYAVSVSVDALGDGSADDVATTFFDGEWKLRLDVAGGWTSQIDLGGQPNPWLTVVDGVRLGGATSEHILVNEAKVGDDYSINHFFAVDADGCLAPAIIFLLEGFTGSWWHSLECEGAYTRYVRTKWHSHDAWDLNVTDVRPDGTLALVDDTMVSGSHPYVEGRGTNNCG